MGSRRSGTLLRAHLSATKQLNAQLVADHGLTLSDTASCSSSRGAPDHRLRRVDLADRILLTASGVTRLLDGLERAGYVERAACDTDRRVVYAVLTDSGLAKLREAAATHLPQIESLFGSQLSESELETLVALLGRLGNDAQGDCEPPAGAG